MDDRGMNQHIDELLADARPDRYDVTDRTWRAGTYAAIANEITDSDARLIAARILVDKRESQATKRANRVLRAIGRTQVWPLDWMDLADVPISVGDERFCLRAATAEILRRWAQDERRDASTDHESRIDACVGAEWLADQMASVGALTLFDAAAALSLGGAA